MPKVLNTGTEDRVCSFSQYKPTLADEIHFFFLLFKLNEMFSRRTIMILGCNYGKILHELNDFWAIKW